VTDLYPLVEPYDHGMLDVGDGNQLYWEVCGNPNGKPAVMVHGGPGQGSAPNMRRMFNPQLYRAVLFDQRGCGRSTPHASDPATGMRCNTTAHLVDDMERLREHLGIDKWVVTGGSWGTTLALVYAQRHPHRVTQILLSAISTTRRSEIDWLYRGARQFFPEEWAAFRAGAPSDASVDELPAAYANLMEDPDPTVRNNAASAWRAWEDTVLSLEPNAQPVSRGPADADTLAFVRICARYYAHGAWLDDGSVIRNAGLLASIPGVLIHGRFDLSCPVVTAYELANAWPGAELLIDDHSGHRGSDLKRTWMLATMARFADM
jgi:proline iminopeptidase